MDCRNPVAGVHESQRRSLGDAISGPMTMAGPWAYRRSSLVLGALPTAVPCARLHARQVLWEWAPPVDIAAAELLVSELVTNGVRAAGAIGGNPPVGLRLSAGNGLVLQPQTFQRTGSATCAHRLGRCTRIPRTASSRSMMPRSTATCSVLPTAVRSPPTAFRRSGPSTST